MLSLSTPFWEFLKSEDSENNKCREVLHFLLPFGSFSGEVVDTIIDEIAYLLSTPFWEFLKLLLDIC